MAVIIKTFPDLPETSPYVHEQTFDEYYVINDTSDNKFQDTSTEREEKRQIQNYLLQD